jgi:hypothetical protein
MAERSNAAVLKTVDCNRSGGSNPSLSADNFLKPATSKDLSGFFISWVQNRVQIYCDMIEIYCDTILKYLKTLDKSAYVDSDEILKNTNVPHQHLDDSIIILFNRKYLDPEPGGFFRINDLGREFITLSSFQEEANKKNAEFQALSLQIQELTDKVSDYHETKRKANHSWIISWITIVLSLLALLGHWMCNKPN